MYSEGYRDFDLVRLCRELEAAGFAGVRVMETGIQGWRLKNNSVYHMDDHRVVPGDIVAASYKPGWLPLYFSVKKQTVNATTAVSFSFSADGGEIKRETETAIERFIKVNGFAPRLLIVSDTGSGYPEIAEKLPAGFRPYSFFLTGGLAAYDRYIEEALTMIRQKRLMAERNTADCRR